jgi:hypothetical protein
MPWIGLVYFIYTKVITHATWIHLYSLLPWSKPSPDLDEATWIVVEPSPLYDRPRVRFTPS